MGWAKNLSSTTQSRRAEVRDKMPSRVDRKLEDFGAVLSTSPRRVGQQGVIAVLNAASQVEGVESIQRNASACTATQTFAAMLNRPESPVSGKVQSIALVYANSEAMVADYRR